MKKILVICIIAMLFSCKKETVITNNSELWVKLGASIEKIEISFIGVDNKNRHYYLDFKYANNVFVPNIKQVDYNGKWTLLNVSQFHCDGLAVHYNNKIYKTRGFYLGERRFVEIDLTVGGEISVTDTDISILDRTVYVN